MGTSIDSSWESTRLKEHIAELEAKLAARDEALKVAAEALEIYRIPDFGSINNNHVAAQEALAKIKELIK